MFIRQSYKFLYLCRHYFPLIIQNLDLPTNYRMKRISLFFLLVLFAATSFAQTYEQLWQKVEKAAKDDLPKTSLTFTHQIMAKAYAEGNRVQMLKASLMSSVYALDIAPDTARLYIGKMESALVTETDPVVQQLTHGALARLYSQNQYNLGREGEYAQALTDSLIAAHFKVSLAQPELLMQAKTADWLPLLDIGKRSRLFDNDMLHVLLSSYREYGSLSENEEVGLLHRFSDLYLANGRRNAALLLALDSLSKHFEGHTIRGRLEDDDYFCSLKAAAEQFQDIEAETEVWVRMTELQSTYDAEGADAYHNDSLLLALTRKALEKHPSESEAAELKNFIARMEQSVAQLSGLNDAHLPASQAGLSLRSRHVTKAILRLTRIMDSAVELRNSNDKQLKALAEKYKKSSVIFTLRNKKPQDICQWETCDTTITLPRTPGIYYAELLAEGRLKSATTFHISALQVINFATANSRNRLTVVDSRTGHPVAAARITAYVPDSKGVFRQQRVYNCDANGEVTIQRTDRRTYVQYAASTSADKASKLFYLSSLYYYGDQGDEKAQMHIDLFTDRAVYRPGQKIAFSGVVYSHLRDDYNTKENVQTYIRLYNANCRLLDSLLVKSDAFGTFSGEFTLPSACLPGQFRIGAEGGNGRSSSYVKVEEYKRPTFTATTHPITTAYALGDTVRLTGEAKTYSGLPVGGAKVKYTVGRTTWFYRDATDFTPQSGEALTDENGLFTLPVSLSASAKELEGSRFNRYYYTVNYTVTAENGETAEGNVTLHAATRAAWLEAAVPSSIFRREGRPLPSFMAKLTNANGETLKATGEYSLVCEGEVKKQGAFQSGTAFVLDELSTLPSGNYDLRFIVQETNDTATTHFTLLSETDRRPLDKNTPFYYYEETTTQGDSVFVAVGSPLADALLRYDVVTSDSLIDSRTISLSDTLLHFVLPYREMYGDGAKVCFALLHNGCLYAREADIRRPEPDKRLQLHWETFRSRLTPGQKEEWRLKVTHPDGTPARANILAGMYDASLNRFGQNVWAFRHIAFSRLIPVAEWSSKQSAYSTQIYANQNLKLLDRTIENFTEWKNELFGMGRYYTRFYNRRGLFRSKQVMMLESEACADVAENVTYDAVAPREADLGMAKKENKVTASGSAMDAASANNASALRTNFAETAFFMPHLQTDARGEATISFTLPESTTAWQFSALAHDRTMNYGQIDTTVTAHKDFMVEPSLPRFMRTGDKMQIPVKVSNLTKEKIDATLRFSLATLEYGRFITQEEQPVSLAAGEVKTYYFDYAANEGSGMWICRITASNGTFADGEEHYLPILGEETEVVRTLPFSMSEKGNLSLRIDTLLNEKDATHRSLTVEVSSNPAWYAVSALPVLAGNASCINVSEWATRYYALVIGRRLSADNPAIHSLASASSDEVDALAKIGTEGLTDLTPWLSRAKSEKERAAALTALFDEETTNAYKHTAIEKLRSLQQSDGSWSWYPGMCGNTWITMDAALLLARAERLSGDRSAHSLLTAAFDFLQQKIAESVREMKKNEKEGKTTLRPDEWQLRYLYLRTLLDKKRDSDASYLLSRAKDLRSGLTMYDKALLAVVLAREGFADDAATTLRSLYEHTVSAEGKGRWFDTPRAELSRQSYRIPTHCMALEAFALAHADSTVSDMRLWLMQAKRTQMWETSRTTADAVYALLSPFYQEEGNKAVAPLDATSPLLYTLYNKNKIVGLNAPSESETLHTAGYFKKTYTAADALTANTLKLTKSANGLSWGSISAVYTLPASKVKAEGKGLFIHQIFEVKRGNEWKAFDRNDRLEKGDRVRCVFTLTADADYDFVQITSPRAACLEPVRALSGYAWMEGLWAYRSLHDAASDFFIEKVGKGTHTFSEEYFVDRSGTFSGGVPKAVCVYAPYFCGTGESRTFNVK